MQHVMTGKHFKAAPGEANVYHGESGTELEEAWRRLIQHTNVRVSAEDLRKTELLLLFKTGPETTLPALVSFINFTASNTYEMSLNLAPTRHRDYLNILITIWTRFVNFSCAMHMSYSRPLTGFKGIANLGQTLKSPTIAATYKRWMRGLKNIMWTYLKKACFNTLYSVSLVLVGELVNSQTLSLIQCARELILVGTPFPIDENGTMDMSGLVPGLRLSLRLFPDINRATFCEDIKKDL